MDFREVLLQNDIRHLTENFQALSDELLHLRNFIQFAFEAEYNNFIKVEGNRKRLAFATSSSFSSRSQMKKPLNSSASAAVTSADYSSAANKKRVRNRSPVPDFGDSSAGIEEGFQDNEIETGGETADKVTVCGSGIPVGYLVQVDVQGNQVPEVRKSPRKRKKKRDSDSDSSGNNSDPDFEISEYIVPEKSRVPSTTSQNTKSKEFSKARMISSKFECPVCQYEVPDKPGLIKHVNEKHTEEETDRIFLCRHCVRQFDKSYTFNKHKKTAGNHKPSNRIVSCRFCGLDFSDTYKRKIHETTHIISGQKPYTCSVCNIGFSRKNYKRYHEKKFHGIVV